MASLNRTPIWSGSINLSFGGPKPERKTREEFMFGTDPIMGYRIWKVGKPDYGSIGDFLSLLADAHDADAGNPYRYALAQTERNLLMPIAVSRGGAWSPEIRSARCTRSEHHAPDLQCECGYWALRSEEELVQAFGDYQPDAWGTVQLWGRFCEFERGFRAQFARPNKVTLLREDPALADELARTYGCDVAVGVPPAAVVALNSADDQVDVSVFGQTSQYLPSLPVGGTTWIPTISFGLDEPKKKWWQRQMVALDRSFMLEQDAERFERRGVRSKWEKDALFEIRAKVRRARADLAAVRARRERKEAA